MQTRFNDNEWCNLTNQLRLATSCYIGRESCSGSRRRTNWYILIQDEHLCLAYVRVVHVWTTRADRELFVLSVSVSLTRREWDCGSSDMSPPCCCLRSGSLLPEFPLQPPSSMPTVTRRYAFYIYLLKLRRS